MLKNIPVLFLVLLSILNVGRLRVEADEIERIFSVDNLQGECNIIGECNGMTNRTISEKSVNYQAVKKDLLALMTDSQEFWPADYGNYGPLMVRLAWHSAGSYRTSDGRGGADGGRQRFEPERSWKDNTNLDKARALLNPIKTKYGKDLSWGDLIVLAGNVAIESMGGPILGFCGGRIDDMDGSESDLLGPTDEQEEYMPCPVNGKCESPLGSTEVGLIYVNPEGPMGEPHPVKSAPQIRDTFARMGMNDRETVALIGGGHSFGKAHGACKAGAGPSPKEDPVNPWPGLCGTGKLEDTYTSGFEFPWTSKPTSWDNEFFVNLLKYQWEVYKGPGGHNQWRVQGNSSPLAPSVNTSSCNQVPIGALTSDVALLEDPAYVRLVEEFASNQTKLDEVFMHAWYKLTTRDMGPVTRCLGNDVPEAQSWQNPLPSPVNTTYNVDAVKGKITETMKNYPFGLQKLARLAWRCSSTFRASDYLGGCNGAFIRFNPQKSWPVNKGLSSAFEILAPIKDEFVEEGLSWSDLIILAGNTALENAGGYPLTFCGGRTDANSDGGASKYLEPKVTGNISNTLADLKNYIKLRGLTLKEFTVLNAAGYALGDNDCDEGFFCSRGPSSQYSGQLSNRFFTDIQIYSNNWQSAEHPTSGKKVYKAVDKDLYMWRTDIYYWFESELTPMVQEYANNNDLFLKDLAKAWTKISNIDRFDGPIGNICDKS